MFKSIRKFAKSLRPESIHEMELKYLSQARDRVDLEMRQRTIDRGDFKHFY
ncbi:DUF3563 domain-containing protein [Rhizobium sp. NRK18]|jgi:hypothetical protein|uniref:DUF3563 domain-containing protein n=1 Tax=Rhizobium sp. NRK18 TaxID=2964667 RepID=UPI0021C311E6|nr:DUF3563 domain-containing protein [Rhizobium sp. NRK18]MCQ2004776.1 DUF3563 domain-containing protein [Rhizobium sp. NRK18]